jgi:putative holliday junction resolvase
MRSLGLDIGGRRIGVSISDPLGINAFPLEVLHDMDPSGLREYVEEKVNGGVSVVVVGLPITPRGREGEQARSTRGFARAIQEIEGVRVEFWDERLSTVEAGKRLREAGRSLKGTEVDAAAAAIFHQAYLDRVRHRDKEEGDGPLI